MLNHVPRMGWAPKGRRVLDDKPAIRQKRYSLLLCVRNNNQRPVVKWILNEGGITAAIFHDFLSAISVDRNTMLILDNARIHKATDVLINAGKSTIQQLADERNFTLEYLPPYVPAVNPTEYCFNTIRQSVESKKPRTEAQLRAAIVRGVQRIRPNMRATFRKAFLENCKPPPDWN